MRPALLTVLLLFIAAAPASASVSRSAVCTVEVRLPSGSGTALCAGWIGPVALDPQESPASVTGACPSAFGAQSGELRLILRRLISFDPNPMVEFTAQFSGTGLVTGRGRMEGADVPLAGAALCTADTLRMDLVLGDAAAAVTQIRTRRSTASPPASPYLGRRRRGHLGRDRFGGRGRGILRKRRAGRHGQNRAGAHPRSGVSGC